VFDLDDKYFMSLALEQAKSASSVGEVPVGAVLVFEGRVVGVGRNTREMDKNPIGHAEIAALSCASKNMDRWRLENTTLYVTLEPCVMCAGAMVLARVERLVFGAIDPKGGAVCSLYQILEDKRMNHQVLVHGGLMEDECGKILKDFFRGLRNRKK